MAESQNEKQSVKDAPRKSEKDLRSEAYGAATRRLRDDNREHFNALVAEEMKARGIDWKPRPTPAEKAKAQIQALLAEHPELASEFAE